MKHNKTTAIEALEELVKDYERLIETGKGRIECPLCERHKSIPEAAYNCGYSCPYFIPEIMEKFGIYGCMFGWEHDYTYWNIEQAKLRLPLIKKVLKFAKTLPASCFKPRKEPRSEAINEMG